jgi:hypothetical protein
MAKRVVLGNIGGTDYGLRVSKPTTDAIYANGTQVPVDNLLFDSLNPIGHMPLWRYYRRQVSAGTRDSTTRIVTPGTISVSYGTTLPFAPYAYVYKEITGGVRSLYGNFSSEFGNYTGSRLDDNGFQFTTTATNFAISNYETTAEWFRVFIFYFGT